MLIMCDNSDVETGNSNATETEDCRQSTAVPTSPDDAGPHQHSTITNSRTSKTNLAPSSSRDAVDGHNSAEAIVRAAARTVRNLRAFLVFVIVAAAASCGVLIYKLASKNEADSFKFNYNAVAGTLKQSFTNVLFENINYAYIISVALSSGLYADSGYTPSFPNVSIFKLDALTNSIPLAGGLVANMIWSPLLSTRKERKSWEKYTATSLESESDFSSNKNPPCYICGDQGHEIVNTNARVTFPGAGTFLCSYIQIGALEGYLNQKQCSHYAPIVQPVCGCQQTNNATVDNSGNDAKNFADEQSSNHSTTTSEIFRFQNGVAVVDHGPPPYFPVRQISPSGGRGNLIMFNQMSQPWRRIALEDMTAQNSAAISETIDPNEDQFYKFGNIQMRSVVATIFLPVYTSSNSNKIAGSLSFDVPWVQLFTKVLSLMGAVDGVTIVLENTLGQMYTFGVKEKIVEMMGTGDLHDTGFDSMLFESSYNDFNQILQIVAPSAQGYDSNSSNASSCSYRIRVYPSEEFRRRHVSNRPAIYTVIVVLAFCITSLVFLAYDMIVRRIQRRVLDVAKRSEEIVSSLFPALVHDRLFRNRRDEPSAVSSQSGSSQPREIDNALVSHKTRLKRYLSRNPPSVEAWTDSEPIADLYPNTTVLFADIAGFTAWSSEREPSQVFKLLETLYGEFDNIARELGVFKVETIGDCYVAATGLPEKMQNHAVVMVEFACRCLVRMRDLVSKLEMTLGPGTADLTIRVGVHSGPITAGVLRGERARFQLFGDTINVASRMESTGEPDMVHISKETAHLLIESGKEHWVNQRQERVSVKGKGQLQTYWVKTLPSPGRFEYRFPAEGPANLGNLMQGSFVTETDNDPGSLLLLSSCLDADLTSKALLDLNGRDRLIEWNVDLLQGLLQRIAIKRKAGGVTQRYAKTLRSESVDKESSVVQFVDEITEVIEMPDFDERTAIDPDVVDLEPAVSTLLRDYVTTVASLYQNNAFHNFEHACHVAMSASKLLKRIITPDDVEYKADECGNKKKCQKRLLREIHEKTFGIISDPLMQFAAVFAALIHDVDHSGLTNQQLVNEKDPLARTYRGKCVAEQRSLQVAWDTLMEDRYAELRRCIYQTKAEKQRFRQLLVNAVIATDIADKELSTWRKNRWDKVFHPEHQAFVVASESSRDRKATIVYEYIIQASDVAHTMQHWHIYQKWNRRLFDERYAAFLNGREPEDPSIGWHKSEIWFFDNYVIPLAKKLEECNVFGVSCDEYLTYALQNRHEWELKGEEIVAEMLAAQLRP